MRGQDTKPIPIHSRDTLARHDLPWIAFIGGPRDQRLQGAVWDALRRWPVESVVIAWTADKPLRVHALPRDLLEQVEVVLLGVHIGETGADRADLVAANFGG